MRNIEKYGIFEVSFSAVGEVCVWKDCALFEREGEKRSASAFRRGKGEYTVRFSPDSEGVWKYRIECGEARLHGEFLCTAAQGEVPDKAHDAAVLGTVQGIPQGEVPDKIQDAAVLGAVQGMPQDAIRANHGKVTAVQDHFCYEDGAMYIPVGTTCYAWIHQPEKLRAQTLKTLSEAPFNKIRMCVFPKSMPYNQNDPDCYPFEKDAGGNWDVASPDETFWNKLDESILALQRLGIEADLILFHPYDRWGFSRLSLEDSLAYLEYCIARLAAFRNIWWSLANEYETVYARELADWDAFGELLQKEDIYHHLISVHDIVTPYPKREWLTHCSIQCDRIDKILKWREEYGVPVVIDECGYEGNIMYGWGNLSAFEMVHRFWWAVCRGGFCTHGETFHRDDEVLWWAKGGKLYGRSAERIAFLKDLLYEAGEHMKPEEAQTEDPNHMDEGEQLYRKLFQQRIARAPEEYRRIFEENTTPMTIRGERHILQYLGRACPAFTELDLEPGMNYRVEVIDIMEMTRTTAAECAGGPIRIALPGKEGIAIFMTCGGENHGTVN